jgi:hypothetical protein
MDKLGHSIDLKRLSNSVLQERLRQQFSFLHGFFHLFPDGFVFDPDEAGEEGFVLGDDFVLEGEDVHSRLAKRILCKKISIFFALRTYYEKISAKSFHKVMTHQ